MTKDFGHCTKLHGGRRVIFFHNFKRRTQWKRGLLIFEWKVETEKNVCHPLVWRERLGFMPPSVAS